MARLREHYTKNVLPELMKEFGYKNIMAVPKIEKISLNIGLGEATDETQTDHSAQFGPITHEVCDRLQQVPGRPVSEEPARKGKGAVVWIGSPLDRSKFLEVDAIGDHGERQFWPQTTHLFLRMVDD